MNRIDLISLLALIVIVAMLPVYAVSEPLRLQNAQENLRQATLKEGALNYGRLCATCHGLAGEGQGVMPALNHPALAEANSETLFRTIARAAHGTGMAAWHTSEGGVLNDYQIGQLVTLIQHADWQVVKTTALENGLGQVEPPAAEMGEAFMWMEDSDDPHRCVACHEEPEVHQERFGPNCARCHSSIAWTPAVLTKHTFLLDHGGEGNLECQTCHVENYFTHSCYACHDHQPDEMQVVHQQESIVEFSNCIDCHPTGRSGEADQLWAGKGQARNSNPAIVGSLP